MRWYFLTLFFTVIVISCTTPKMAINKNSWNNVEELTVTGRKGIFTKESMQFGDYKTIAVKRSWTKGSSSKNSIGTGNSFNDTYRNIISIEYIDKKQTLKFNLSNNSGDSSEVYCVTKFKAEDLQIGNNHNSIVNIATELFLNTDKSSNTYYAQIYTSEIPSLGSCY